MLREKEREGEREAPVVMAHFDCYCVGENRSHTVIVWPEANTGDPSETSTWEAAT